MKKNQLIAQIGKYWLIFIGITLIHTAQAAVINGVSVTSNSERHANGQDRVASHIVDGSGFDSINRTHSAAPEGNMWLNENGHPGFPSGTPLADVWLKFDLGAWYDVSHMDVWNYNESGFTNRGIQEVKVLVSDVEYADLDQWTTLYDSLVLDIAPGSEVMDFSQLVDFDVSHVRYVYIDVQSNWGSSEQFVGLSEVQFDGQLSNSIDLPGTLSLIGLGYIFVFRRNKQSFIAMFKK